MVNGLNTFFKLKNLSMLTARKKNVIWMEIAKNLKKKTFENFSLPYSPPYFFFHS